MPAAVRRSLTASGLKEEGLQDETFIPMVLVDCIYIRIHQ